MTDEPLLRTGAKALVDALSRHGVELIFCVPGESFLDVLDAAHDVATPRLITCRHEGGAAFMAEAQGKLTGRPGVAFVTRGPGACNAAIGVHTASQDSTPMVLFVGQIARGHRDREAFQEIDYRRMFGGVAKWVTEIDHADRVPELVARAFHVAASGRPGPVVVALPEDMLAETTDAPDTPATPATVPQPAQSDIARIGELLPRAERPMVLVGGSGWTDEACAALRDFVEANALPTCCAFRRQDILNNESPCHIGDLGTGPNPKLIQRVGEADLLIVIGARLGEVVTRGYTLLDRPLPRQAMIHIHPCAEELGRVFRPDVAVQAAPSPTALALATLPPIADPPWAGWARECRDDYLDWLAPAPCVGEVDLGLIFDWLRERLPEDSLITTDAGNFSGWPQRYLLYRRPGRQLGPTSGAMGYGVPAAIAAKLTEPKRVVVGFCGDGGFMMTGQELATAHLHGAAPIIIVINNGMYGTIRMHQERRFPGRVSATTLANPDFAMLAQAHGCFGVAVERTADFVPAFWEAMWSRRPAVIELRVNPEQITTTGTLAALRGGAVAAPPPSEADDA